jgi:hypothetical protein
MRELLPFERLIDHLDKRGKLFNIYRLVVFIVNVEHPLPVVLELNIGLVDLLSPLFFVKTLFI